MRYLSYSLMFLFLAPCMQGPAQIAPQQLFGDIRLRIDTSMYSWKENQIEVADAQYLWFEYRQDDPVVELQVFPKYWGLDGISLAPGDGYEPLDTFRLVNGEYYRAKLQLRNITQTEFLTLTIQARLRYQEALYNYELGLFPVTKTRAYLPDGPEELFIGEEKVIPLESDNPQNIKAPENWTSGLPVNYRFSRKDGRIRLHLLPNEVGTQVVSFSLSLRKPFLNEKGQPVYQAPTVTDTFVVKPAKLAFLGIDRREVSYDQSAAREEVEIELKYHPMLEMRKTYRLEAREEPGGALAAEIFTRNVLGNGRVLCWLRIYAYHRRSDGNLYIKDGDKAVFITNFDIIPRTEVQKVSLRREGQDWQESHQVFPGERIEVKVEGLSLHRADLRFDGLVQVQKDSVVSSDREVAFSGVVPVNIGQKNIRIYNGTEQVGPVLRVKEYERPRPFDFVSLRYGNDSVLLKDAEFLIFFEGTLNDITIQFHNNRIDQGRLHGQQELEIDIQVLEKGKNLLDQREIRNLVACPGPASPRFASYPEEGCRQTDIRVNEYLRKKTFELDPWTTIRLTVRHKPEKYGRAALSKTVEFVLFRKSSFDIDVSFPAGLVVKKLREPGFGNLGGISMAMIAQFSFYREKNIAKEKPYKFGFGFLAFDAFNFSDSNDNRDVGIVGLASLYPIPTKERSRLSFPLYAGGGYFLSESKWFLLFGPGIRVRL
ncbi:MAG: hypothetical protein J5I94_10915 [Phaeodactylibacter sp.]|nr:hypothetical protein [Phaeodactylibacter sp.]